MFPFRNGPLSRRELLQLSAAGALSLPVSGWFDRLAAHAADDRRQAARAASCCS